LNVCSQTGRQATRSDGYEGLEASQRAAAPPSEQAAHDYVPLNNLTTTSGPDTIATAAAADDDDDRIGDARVSQQYLDQFGYLRVFADEPQQSADDQVIRYAPAPVSFAAD